MKNLESNETVYLSGGQTYANHSMYPEKNSVKAFSGYITFQYLGDNKAGATLFGGAKSSYEGPVLNIIETLTEGLGVINNNAQLIGDNDQTPFRIHSDQKIDGMKVSKASGGCFIFGLAQLQKMSEAFKAWNVKPGAKFGGHLQQDFPQ